MQNALAKLLKTYNKWVKSQPTAAGTSKSCAFHRPLPKRYVYGEILKINCFLIMLSILTSSCSSTPESHVDNKTNKNCSLPKNNTEILWCGIDSEKGSIFKKYLDALHKHPNIKGIFHTQWSIEKSGVVKDVRIINSELGVSYLEQEILSLIKEITFKPLSKDIVVNYKFEFLPK